MSKKIDFDFDFDFEISPSPTVQRELGERKEWEDESQRWGLMT
jgi:hypothetical protein